MYSIKPTTASTLIACLVTALQIASFAQDAESERPSRTLRETDGTARILRQVDEVPVYGVPDRDCDRRHIFMEMSLEWTDYRLHRVNDDSPFEITLSGNIASNRSLFWNLATLEPQAHLPPHLYFVSDVLGRTGPEFGSDIPLGWEIAIDGGLFAPLTLNPDNTLSTTFPPGFHTFQLRISGCPQHHQPNGYYLLQLQQRLVPQL